jgi:hypothetical protein
MLYRDGIGDKSVAEQRRSGPSEIKIRQVPRFDEDETAHERGSWNYEHDAVDLTPYIRAIRERWRTIMFAACAGAAVTAAITGLALPRWYRATAVIRPIATPAVESRIGGLLGGIGGGLGGAGLGGLAASLGAGGNDDAEEYIAILQGFQFNVALVQRHHLAPLLKPAQLTLLLAEAPADLNWMDYRALKKRFNCEYSIKTGDITLTFEALNRRDAEKVLSYYIDDLRDILRAREISVAAAAAESLETEAQMSPDPVLRSELYELVAKQVQRKKMAQVEADFAFRVLDPPAASDKHYRPTVLLDCLLVFFFMLLGMTACVMCSPSFEKHADVPRTDPSET